MPTLYIMSGVGFAGKSTLAKKVSEYFDIPLVSQDALYFEKEKEFESDQDGELHWELKWEMLLDMCKSKIREYLSAGKSVVFDSTNLKRTHRDDLVTLAKETGGKSVVIYLDTPEELLTVRQEKNKVSKERHDVEQHYLDQAKEQLEVPSRDENAFAFTPATNVEEFLAQLPK